MKDLQKIELLEIPLASCSENITKTGYCLAFHLCNWETFYTIKLMYLGIKIEILRDNDNEQEKFIQFDLYTEHIKVQNLVSNSMDEFGFVFDKNEKYQFTQYDVKITKREFQNSGLGSYCMNHVITWAKEKFLNASLKKTILSIVDAETEREKTLRNSFYKKCGFTLSFDDESEKTGRINGVIKDLTVPEIKSAIIIHPNGLQQLATYMKDNFLNENELEKKSKKFQNYIYKQTNKMSSDYRQGAKYGFWGGIVTTGIIVSIIYKIF